MALTLVTAVWKTGSIHFWITWLGCRLTLNPVLYDTGLGPRGKSGLVAQ
ncbi:MAG: hypothetical protein GY719_35390 [bacterium]|nr:hypothetical protein [bacterium]